MDASRVPHLRIVSDALWKTAHDRLAATRATYLTSTKGKPFGRPLDGLQSKYLLPRLSRCGVCGGSVEVHSRLHGNGDREVGNTALREVPGGVTTRLETAVVDAVARLWH